VSFWAEALGIDSGGSWGFRRIFVAALGIVFAIASLIMALLGATKRLPIYKISNNFRYSMGAAPWVLVALVLCELILRTIIVRNPDLIYEKEWGVVPIPGSTRFWGQEGSGITHYLSHGEIATPYADGDFSVVVLGDSNTEALQVSDGNKFVSLAEANIRSTGKTVNLHNLGMSSNSIPDYIYLAPYIIQEYNPAIIVVQLSPQDFWGPDGGDSFNSKHRNYFIKNDSEGIKLVHKNQYFEPSLYNTFSQNSIVYCYGGQRLKQIKDNLNLKSSNSNQAQPVHTSGNAILPVAKLDEQLNLLKEAFWGIKLILLILPYSPIIDHDYFSSDDAENQKIIKSAEKIGGFSIVYPLTEFNRMIPQGHLPRGFMNSPKAGVGHLNIYGHRIIGELLAEKILGIIE